MKWLLKNFSNISLQRHHVSRDLKFKTSNYSRKPSTVYLKLTEGRTSRTNLMPILQPKKKHLRLTILKNKRWPTASLSHLSGVLIPFQFLAFQLGKLNLKFIRGEHNSKFLNTFFPKDSKKLAKGVLLPQEASMCQMSSVFWKQSHWVHIVEAYVRSCAGKRYRKQRISPERHEINWNWKSTELYVSSLFYIYFMHVIRFVYLS